jgi:hypothetical protein
MATRGMAAELGKGGTVTLYLDGQPIGSGRVERTEPIGFGYECTDDSHDHLIDPAQFLHLVMAKQ